MSEERTLPLSGFIRVKVILMLLHVPQRHPFYASLTLVITLQNACYPAGFRKESPTGVRDPTRVRLRPATILFQVTDEIKPLLISSDTLAN